MEAKRERSRLAQAFFRDDAGQVAILFGLIGFAILTGVAGGADLMRLYQARQKLSETALMACQFATRPSVVSVVSGSGVAAYNTKVNAYITNAIGAQKLGFTLTNTAPFSYSGSGASDVTLSTNVKMAFAKVLNAAQFKVSATSHCFDTIATIDQPPSSTASTTVVNETFAVTGCTGSSACGYLYAAPGTKVAVGAWGYTLSTPTSVSSSTVGYTGSSGVKWVILGYCLEVDSKVYSNAVPAGAFNTAELDCDNGSGSAGNSSISTMQYLAGGNYELRYFYNSRVKYPDYDPTYICGSTASDVSWATSVNSTYISNSSTTTSSSKLRSNQINVYLDANTGGTPPLHQTIDGTQYLGGSNLIDVCVYSGNFEWVERSVRIYVNTPGNYWLSFSADGAGDSYGGAIADVRLCTGSCSGSVQDNYPWTASSVLFEDKFDSPTYSYSTSGSSAYINTTGNMTSSTGTSGASSGWPNQAASGWGAAPVNQLDYVMKAAAVGLQAVELDGSGTTTRRLISRGFLLDPGYYKVAYNYISDGQFSSLSSVYCAATPSAANVAALSGSATATSRATGATASIALTSNMIGVFMSHSLEASAPVVGGALGSTTSYKNPDGTTTTTPTVAPDGLSLTNYDATQVNPLLDICGYAAAWQSRSANVLVTKPGFYWLTFSSLGTPSEKFGGALDDVKLTALGGPSMSGALSSYVTLPTPSVAPGSISTFSGFEIVSDPITVPAAAL
jgi:Flp pilus assembly protein TadG